VGDATFNGIGLNLGAGTEYAIFPSAKLKAEALYRFYSFSSASDRFTSGDIKSSLTGGGLSFDLGLV
jgi:opacity protein-like surface antigen